MAMRYKSKLLLLFFLAALSPCTHPFQVKIVDRFLCTLAGRSRFGSMDLLAFAQFTRCKRYSRLVLSHCTCWSRLVLSCSSRCSKLHTKRHHFIFRIGRAISDFHSILQNFIPSLHVRLHLACSNHTAPPPGTL